MQYFTGASGFDLRYHHLLRAERDDDRAGSAQGIGGVHASQPRIAAAAAIEVDSLRVGGIVKGGEAEGADAARLKRAGGLEVLEFEEDSSRGFGEVGGLDQWRMTPGLAGDGRRLLLQVSRHSCAVKDLRWKKNGAGERGYM